jgi:hypothetical protein
MSQRRRRAALSVAATIALLVAAPLMTTNASAAGVRRSAAAVSCQRGTTVVANRLVRVFQTAGELYDHAFWACARRSRRATYLFEQDASVDGAEPRLAIAGRFVGYESRACFGGDHDSPDGCDSSVVVRDVTRRRSWRTKLPDLSGDSQPGFLLSIVLTARGWVAWQGYRTTFNTLEIWAMAPGGAVRKIAEGPLEGDIAAPANGSLAVTGDRLYWQFGDNPEFTLLR